MFSIRHLKLLLLVMLMAGATVACTPSADTGDADMSPEPAAEEMPAEPEVIATEAEMPADDAMSVDDLMADPLGVVEVAAGDPVDIGAMFVLSGANADLGTDSRDGVELAVADFGPLKGHEIELTTEDEQCTPEGGQTAATRLAANDNLVGVIGSSCSSAAKPAIPILNEAGLVMISPSNTAPELTADDRPAEFSGYLRTAHNDLFQGSVAADYAYTTLGLQTAATIHDGSPYAEQLQQVFADRFTELGGTVVAQEAIQVGDSDMSPVLTSIASNSPEIIYLPIFIAEGGFVTAQARETPGLESTALMGADGLYSPSFVDAAGAAAEGMYLSGPYVAASDRYNGFLEKLQAAYNRGPVSGFHAHAYDATMMLLDAVSKASAETDDGTLVIGRQAVRDALFATKDFDGLTGMLTCGAHGDCATGEALAIFKIGAEEVEDPSGNWPPEVVYP